MTGNPDDPVGNPIDTDQTDAFDTLGHELRLSIIETLGARQRANSWEPVPMGFEELRRALGSQDSGRFNYHLDKLLGTYLDRTDAGYILTPAGFEVSSAILRGSYANVSPGPVEGPVDGDCPVCAADVTGVYEDGLFRIVCPEHGNVFSNTVPPAVAIDRGIDAIHTAAGRDVRQMFEQARDGVCPECSGLIEVTIPVTEARHNEPESADSDPLTAQFECQRCQLVFDAELRWLVFDHPAVVSFYYDHDIDIGPENYIGFDSMGDAAVSEDPLRARLTFRADNERLDVVLDEAGGVVETERC